MNISQIPAVSGNNFNVIIEVPMHSSPVKYELHKESGALFVDRFLATPMHYPCNYGFIPHTLSEDGDPVDVLVVSDFAINPLSVVAVKPIGVLLMEDEKGHDEKIIAVPALKLNSVFESIDSHQQLPALLLKQIQHFFEHYKDLEKNKWVKVVGFESVEIAKQLIQKAIERVQK